jgi:hypothetical protein
MSELQCVVRDPWPAKFQKSMSASFAWVGLKSFTCPRPVRVQVFSRLEMGKETGSTYVIQ